MTRLLAASTLPDWATAWRCGAIRGVLAFAKLLICHVGLYAVLRSCTAVYTMRYYAACWMQQTVRCGMLNAQGGLDNVACLGA